MNFKAIFSVLHSKHFHYFSGSNNTGNFTIYFSTLHDDRGDAIQLEFVDDFVNVDIWIIGHKRIEKLDECALMHLLRNLEIEEPKLTVIKINE
jgi:hypothetical protein